MKTDLAPIFNAKAAEFGAKAVENGLNEIFQYCICKTLRTLPDRMASAGRAGYFANFAFN